MPPRTKVVAVRTARRAARSGAVWGLGLGAYVASSSLGYAATYPTAAARARLAASLGTNAGLAALLGPARDIGTVAGFTAWRATAVLSVAGALWGLLLATRMLRGEEDAGRWELYLCGQTTRRGAAAQAVAGLGAGLAALWAVTSLLTVAAGRAETVKFPVTGSVYLATCLVAGATMFLAVGALMSELAANRRQANGIGAAALGVAYVTRMVADSAPGLAGMRWASPLGWIEQLRPLDRPAPLALLPIVGLTVVAATAAIVLGGRRDLGASALPSRDHPPPRTTLLGSPIGLAIRQIRPAFIGWVGGMAAFGLVLGLVSHAAATAITASPTMQQAIAHLGGHAGGSGVKEYLGFAFVTAAAIIAFAAAGQIGATRTEEASTRVDHLLVGPVSRARWLVGRLEVGVALVFGIGALTGLATWAGLAAQGGGVGIGELLVAGLNVIPAAIFVLGAGALVYGVAPRWAAGAAYSIVGWSFVVQLIGTFVTTNQWLLDTSVLAHLAPAPAVDPDWVNAGWLAALGLLAAAAGIAGFGRRDLVAD